MQEITLNGRVLASFQHGRLNAPWGLAIAPPGFGGFTGHILVGNFGDGRITGFTKRLKQAANCTTPTTRRSEIDGLWGLIPGNGGGGGNANDIYFSAGSNDEADGLFGSLAYTP